MVIRVQIQWTRTALASLKQLPKKVREGIVTKAEELHHTDPRQAHKPLLGPLQGLRSLKYSRYRALYLVQEKKNASGAVYLDLTVCFVLAGIRKEQAKVDVYRLAEKLVRLKLLEGLNQH